MPAFKQAWPTEGDFKLAKKEWILAFQAANINSISQLKKGIDHFRIQSKAFVPSPGEFIAMCKSSPEDIGAPSLVEAYKEAIRNSYPDGTKKTWSHPCVRYAAQKSDSYFLRTESKQRTQNVFQKNYLDAIEQFGEGKILHQIENKKTDTIDNRIKFQEQWGGQPANIRPIYADWLEDI